MEKYIVKDTDGGNQSGDSSREHKLSDAEDGHNFREGASSSSLSGSLMDSKHIVHIHIVNNI